MDGEPELSPVEMVRQTVGESAMATMEMIDEEMVEALGGVMEPVERAARVMLDKGMERKVVVGILTGAVVGAVYG